MAASCGICHTSTSGTESTIWTMPDRSKSWRRPGWSRISATRISPGCGEGSGVPVIDGGTGVPEGWDGRGRRALRLCSRDSERSVICRVCSGGSSGPAGIAPVGSRAPCCSQYPAREIPSSSSSAASSRAGTGCCWRWRVVAAVWVTRRRFARARPRSRAGLPGRRLRRGGRLRRRPHRARRHRLVAVPADPGQHVLDLEGRPGDLRRRAGRHARRRARLPDRAAAVLDGGRLRRARARPGAGDRAGRQLHEPGALRPPQQPAVGDPDRPSAAAVPARAGVPADVPVRGAVGSGGARRARVVRAPHRRTGCGRGRCSRSTPACTRSAGSGSRRSASTPPTTSSASGWTSGSPALVCDPGRRPRSPSSGRRRAAPRRLSASAAARGRAASRAPSRARLAACRAIATGAGERRSITVADRSSPGSDAASTWPSATTDRQLPIAAGSCASEEAAWGRSHARAHCSARALPAAASGPPLRASTMSSRPPPRSSSRAAGRSRPRTRR